MLIIEESLLISRRIPALLKLGMHLNVFLNAGLTQKFPSNKVPNMHQNKRLKKRKQKGYRTKKLNKINKK